MTPGVHRLIVAGGRDFACYASLSLVLNTFYATLLADGKQLEVVCGGARGADSLGERWATQFSVPVVRMPADWNTHGKSAGYKRNAQMAEVGHELVAFWDGKSKGTGHMIDLARAKGLPITVVGYKI